MNGDWRKRYEEFRKAVIAREPVSYDDMFIAVVLADRWLVQQPGGEIEIGDTEGGWTKVRLNLDVSGLPTGVWPVFYAPMPELKTHGSGADFTQATSPLQPTSGRSTSAGES